MTNRDSAFVVWREMFGGVFSTLGRMAQIADCYDPQTGRYHHDRVVDELGLDEAHRTLRMAHELVWSDWMLGSLSQQKSDVYVYLSTGSQELSAVIADWKVSKPFLDFIPTWVEMAERTLFTGHLKIILELLSRPYVTKSAAEYATNHNLSSILQQQLVSLTREQYNRPDLSLKLLSAQVHLSERHAGRTFKEFTGQSFRQYLRHLRITEAARLLISSAYEVKAVAVLVGYGDRSHFGEDFRDLIGLTPVQYRAKRSGIVVTQPDRTIEDLRRLYMSDSLDTKSDFSY